MCVWWKQEPQELMHLLGSGVQILWYIHIYTAISKEPKPVGSNHFKGAEARGEQPGGQLTETAHFWSQLLATYTGLESQTCKIVPAQMKAVNQRGGQRQHRPSSWLPQPLVGKGPQPERNKRSGGHKWLKSRGRGRKGQRGKYKAHLLVCFIPETSFEK